MNKIIISALFIFINIHLYSQSNSKGWETHTSMKEVKKVNISGDNVWASSSGGLFTFNLNSPQTTIKKYTTLDGLLSNELTSSVVDNSGNVWTGAADGSISFFSPSANTWRGINDIKNSNEPSKRINDFFPYGNYMLISTAFCLVKFNINLFQFVDQPIIHFGGLQSPTPIYETIVINDTVWAATQFGIAYANINSSLPISSSWFTFTTSNSVLPNNQVNTVVHFDNKIFFGTERGMVYFQNNSLNTYAPLYNGNPIINPIVDMAVYNNSLYFSTYRDTNNIYKVDINNINNAQLVSSGLPLNSITIGPNGDIYAGTQYKGVDILSKGTSTSIVPNGPFSNLFSSVAVDLNKNVWAVSGALGTTWSLESGIYKYDGTQWKNYTYDNYPQLGNGCCGWTKVYPSRFNPNDIWVGSLGNGLLKINGDSLTRYTETNSILQTYAGPGFVIASSPCEDNNGDLWVMNNYTTRPFVNFTKQQGYPVPVGNSPSYFFDNLVIDNYNTKWTTLDNSEPGTPRGVLYFNENINSARLISLSELGQDIIAVYDVIVEKNGEVWIATNNGIVIVSDPSQVVSNPGSLPNMFKMRIIENGLSTPLLENVISLKSDALNNKWIGTFTNGVIYVSPDGSTLLKRYTTLNSPIADDKIVSIGSDAASGKVYFGTYKGLSAYSTIAVEPLEECTNIKTGPNPFIVPNDNLLRIDGLVAESTVKILSISGTMVAQFDTQGGRIATWDGRDLNGNFVSSGIYIIVGFNKAADKVCTGKVAVVRK